VTTRPLIAFCTVGAGVVLGGLLGVALLNTPSIAAAVLVILLVAAVAFLATRAMRDTGAALLDSLLHVAVWFCLGAMVSAASLLVAMAR